eukprot:jgi/Botrbrau1/796/Bobra.0181s0049.1
MIRNPLTLAGRVLANSGLGTHRRPQLHGTNGSRGFASEAPSADAAQWAAPGPKSGRHMAVAPGAAHREAEDFTRAVDPPIVKPPFTDYWTIQRHYLFVGLMPTQDESTDWLPDPSFTNLPLTVPDLWMQQVADGPCPGSSWVGYSKLYSWKNSSGETSLQQKTTFAWGDDPKCCGSGTHVPESCQLANITWYTRPDGKEDLRIYDPKDPENPLLTVEGLWRPLMPYLTFPFPNSELWGYGILRTFFNDIVPQTNGTLDKDGKPIITSRLQAFWDGEGNWTPLVMDNLGGSRSSDVPGLFPVGISGIKGSNLRARYFLV